MTPRWQPPHPDPTKATTEPDPNSRRTREMMRLARDNRPRFLCTWFDCTRLADDELGIPLCIVHAKTAAAAYKRITDTLEEAQATEAEAKRQALEAATTKLDEDIPLDKGEPIPGWIYYIRIGDTIKIGYAADVRKRMRAYPPNAELLAVEPGTRKLERARHSLFHAHLAHGREWFRDNPELQQWIATVLAKHGDRTWMAHTYTSPVDKQPNRRRQTDEPPLVTHDPPLARAGTPAPRRSSYGRERPPSSGTKLHRGGAPCAASNATLTALTLNRSAPSFTPATDATPLPCRPSAVETPGPHPLPR